jgi:hypothetical protein
MSDRAMNWLSNILRLNSPHALVLKTLCYRHNSKRGAAWPGIPRIARESNGIGESTARRCIKDLEALGLISVFKIVINGHAHNAYRMNFGRIISRPRGVPWAKWLREEAQQQSLKNKQPGESKAAYADRLVRLSGIMPQDWRPRRSRAAPNGHSFP